jgi:type II secretory pathway component GspD/PulD (secretin)
VRRSFIAAALAACLGAAGADAQVQQTAAGLSLNFVEADVRAVLQALTPYLDRTLVFGELGGARISLQSPRPVPPGDVLTLLRSALATRNIELVEDGSTYTVRQRTMAPPQPQFPQPGPVAQGPGGTQLSVIRLRHARAADVAATVNALYGRASALGELGARPSTLSGELRDNRNAAYGDPNAPGGQASPRSGQFQGDVAIVPDPRTNSLLIRASRADFELIQAAVNEVDLRPLQVVIQVTIAEVIRNTDLAYALSA